MTVRSITKILNDCIQWVTNIIFTINTCISNNTTSYSRNKFMYIVTTSNNCIISSRYEVMCRSIWWCSYVNCNCSCLLDYCTSSCRYKCMCRCIYRFSNIECKCIRINDSYFNPLTTNRISLSRIRLTSSCNTNINWNSISSYSSYCLSKIVYWVCCSRIWMSRTMLILITSKVKRISSNFNCIRCC